MKRRLLCSAAFPAITALIAGPALAAPPVAYSNWTGWYVGAFAGGAWGRSHVDTNLNCGGSSSYICDGSGSGAGNDLAVNSAGSGIVKASGFTGGLEAGYNWQLPAFVYGFETDLGAFHLKGSHSGYGTYPSNYFVSAGDPFNVNSSFRTDWLLTFRGRFGVPVTPSLFAFVTGGLALTDVKVNTSFSDPYGSGSGSGSSGLKPGWVVGAGLEWAVNTTWSIKAEYLYLNFGGITASEVVNTGGGYAQGISTNFDLTAQIARVGVNHHF